MSYTFLLDAVAESSAESFSDIPASVLSRLNLTAERFCSKDSETEYCHASPSGMTCEHLTANHGEEKSMLSAADSPVRTSVLPVQGLESKDQEVDSGEKWPEPFGKLDRATSSWKIRQLWLFADLDESLATWPKWGMMLDGECWDVETPEGCTNAIESGLLHLPTIGKNEFKGSSQKRFLGSQDFRGAKMSEGLRTCKTDPIYLDPAFAEKVMNWPITWTELAPLETGKVQQWLNSHGKPCEEIRTDNKI
jgi:hypothetical protein